MTISLHVHCRDIMVLIKRWTLCPMIQLIFFCLTGRIKRFPDKQIKYCKSMSNCHGSSEEERRIFTL